MNEYSLAKVQLLYRQACYREDKKIFILRFPHPFAVPLHSYSGVPWSQNRVQN